MKTKKLDYITGMRGLASLLVLFCHFSLFFMPGLFDLQCVGSYFEKIWMYSPLNVFTNGNAPVVFFFVCSGYLITMHVEENQQRGGESKNTEKDLLYRILKILPLIAVGMIFSFLIMKLGIMHHMELKGVNAELVWAERYNYFEPSIISLLKDFFHMFFYTGCMYNAPLWTMRFEIVGSILITVGAVYATACSWDRGRYIVPAVVLLFFSPYLSAFFVGGAVYEFNKRKIKIPVILSIGLILFGIYMACTPLTPVYIWAWMRILPNELICVSCRCIGIGVLLFFSIKSEVIKGIFSIKPIVNIGKLSTPIYILHFPILQSFGSILYIELYKKTNKHLLFILIVISCTIIIIGMAMLYELMVGQLKKWRKFRIDQA